MRLISFYNLLLPLQGYASLTKEEEDIKILHEEISHVNKRIDDLRSELKGHK
jgi:cob(I)alamin adenosyltransferase